MIVADEDALICDFAQYYYVLDYRALPARLAATLAAGLPEDARSMRRRSNMNVSMGLAILSMIYDCTNWLCWTHTRDGQKNANRPKLLYDQLCGIKTEQHTMEKSMSFSSSEEFDIKRHEILGV